MKKASKNGVSLRGGDKTFLSLADLTPDPKNARKHNPRNVGMLVDSLHQVGAARSIVVDENGVVLAGNATIEAAAEAGIHRVKTVEADGSEIVAVVRRGLSKEQKTKLALYDNRVAELAEWNPDILAQLTESKELEGMFSDKELAEILTQTGIEPKDAEPQIDKAEELRQKWGTETGQLWVIGNHRLLVGDATNKADVERVCADVEPSMVFCDPPYGIEIVSSTNKVGGDKAFGKVGTIHRGMKAKPIIEANTYAPIIGDDTVETAVNAYKVAAALYPKAVHIWWGGNYYADHLPASSCWIVWDKENGESFFADAELAWTNQTTAVRIFKHRWNGLMKASERGDKRVHPTQKPVALAVWCFERYGNKGDVILDQFVGSGTSMLAAENTNRSVCGIEMSAGYCAVILERMTTAFPHLKIERVDRAEAA